jgi:hypothetical protein
LRGNYEEIHSFAIEPAQNEIAKERLVAAKEEGMTRVSPKRS